MNKFITWLRGGTLLLLLLSALSCGRQPRDEFAATARPQATPEETPPRRPAVIILSLDGARADLVEGYMEDGTMPHLAALASRGVRAEYASSVDPTLTAAAHNSIATGYYPARTGIVSNRYHLWQNPIYWYTDAFDQASAVEPVWQIAKREGLTTATLFWPGASPQIAGLQADYSVGYGKREVYSASHQLTFKLAEGWVNAPPSYSPTLEASFEIEIETPVYLLALDFTDDQRENYDTFILDRDKVIGQESATLTEGKWAPLVIYERLGAGAYFRITDADLSHFVIFQSRVYSNVIAPRQLAEEIFERFGFFPPSPDWYALEHGWIKEADYMEMMEIQSRWITEVTIYVYTTYHPRLTFAWQGPPDEAGHQFLLVDERQTLYAPERAQKYAEYLRQGYELADENLGRLLGAVDLEEAVMMVVSDHGMAPVQTRVYVNTVLAQAGLAAFKQEPSFPLDERRSQAVGFASGGAANVYIHLQGKSPGGIVAPEDYREVQDRIVAAFEALTDPASGERVFARVVRHQDLEVLHLDNENSGDVFVQANLGYYPSDWRGEEEVLKPIEYPLGQHGYDSSLPEMRAIFIAAGNGIKEEAVIGPVRLIDVAPTVARTLGLPYSADGQILEAIFK